MQVLTFEVGGLACAIAVSRAREVLDPPPVTLVPGAPVAVSGVLALRGEIVTVVDLATRLGVASACARPALLVVHGPADVGPCALRTDRLTGLASVDPAALSLPPGLGVDGELLHGVAVHEDGMLLVLDLDRLLEPDALLRQRRRESFARSNANANTNAAARTDPPSPPSQRSEAGGEGRGEGGRSERGHERSDRPLTLALSPAAAGERGRIAIAPSSAPRSASTSSPRPSISTAASTALRPVTSAARKDPPSPAAAGARGRIAIVPASAPAPAAPPPSRAPALAPTPAPRAARTLAPLAAAAIVAAALLVRWALTPFVDASAAPSPVVARIRSSPSPSSPAPAPAAEAAAVEPLAPAPPRAPASPPPAPDRAPASPPPAAALPPTEVDRPVVVVVVERGDSLWRLAGRHLGANGSWPRLHRANRDTVADPDRITPGMRLVVPDGGARAR